MTEPSVIHIVGVTAVWIIFLSAIRFALVGLHGLRPIVHCAWQIVRSSRATLTDRRRWFIESLDVQYGNLVIALTTRWSVALLFAGMVLIGGGLSMGSIGDVAQLVARSPGRWDAFDRGMDFGGAILLALGMASVHAAVTRRRSLSLIISAGFAIMGAGIGVVTVVHP